MSNINDLWVSYLKSEGYTGNSFPDLLKQALQDQASSTAKSINDLWRDFLTTKGYTGAAPQSLYEYLGSLGYTGALPDRLTQSLTAGDLFSGVLFDPAVLYASGEAGDYWDFTDSSTLYQDTLKTTPVTTSGDVIGAAVGVRGVLDITQATTANKPLWQASATGRFGALLGLSTTRKSLSGSFGSGFSGDITLVFGGCNNASSDGGSILLTQYDTSSNRIHGNIATSTNYANAGAVIGGTNFSTSNANGTGTTAGPDYVLVITHDNATQTMTLDVKIGAGAKESFSLPTSTAAFGNNFAVGINIAATTLVARTVASRVLTLNRKASTTEIDNLISWAGGSA